MSKHKNVYENLETRFVEGIFGDIGKVILINTAKLVLRVSLLSQAFFAVDRMILHLWTYSFIARNQLWYLQAQTPSPLMRSVSAVPHSNHAFAP